MKDTSMQSFSDIYIHSPDWLKFIWALGAFTLPLTLYFGTLWIIKNSNSKHRHAEDIIDNKIDEKLSLLRLYIKNLHDEETTLTPEPLEKTNNLLTSSPSEKRGV